MARGNFAKGGASLVRVWMGKALALLKPRPESSLRSLGTSIRMSALSGNGALNSTALTALSDGSILTSPLLRVKK